MAIHDSIAGALDHAQMIQERVLQTIELQTV